MKVTFLLKTYNAYGGQASFNALAQYLSKGLESCLGPIEQLEVHLYFRHQTFASPDLVDLYQGHQQLLNQLGYCQWQNTKRCLELHYISDVCDGESLNLAWRQQELELSWLLATARELELQWQQFKPQLPLHVLEQLDETELALNCRLAAVRRFSGLFAKPDSYDTSRQRALLLQRLEQQQGHFLWSFADELAPNGNDIGSDSLHFFRDWLEGQRHISMQSFVGELLRQYGIEQEWQQLDAQQRQVYFQCVVGLAFACYKTTRFCEQSLRDKACAALSERMQAVNEPGVKQKYGICLATLAAMPTNLLN